jgi:hypothetical protein
MPRPGDKIHVPLAEGKKHSFLPSAKAHRGHARPGATGEKAPKAISPGEKERLNSAD